MHTDKYRLLSDKSTSNVSIEAVEARIEDRDRQLIEIDAEIKKLTGEDIGNK